MPPPNQAALTASLINLANFDIIPSTEITDYLFGPDNFSSKAFEPLNDILDSLGYNSTNFIYNFGTMFYVISLYIVLFIFACIVSLVTKYICWRINLCIRFRDFLWSLL